MADNFFDFRKEMIRFGIVSYDEQETVWDIKKRCKAAGVPMAAAIGLMGAQAGSFIEPGLGTVAGAALGAIIGLQTGTAMCVSVNLTYRAQMKQLATGKLN